MAGTVQVIIICIAIYLIVLIGLGLFANNQRKSNSLKDFYLAGGNLGSFVLLLTLYATQYSSNTMLVVEALIKANKDFDLILFPNKRHGYGDMTNYMTRRKWDYFVKHLKNMEPTREFPLEEL